MAGPIRIAILANGSQARREISQVQGSLGRLSGVATKAAKFGFGALVVGAGAFAKSAVDVEKKFSTTMRLIQANTRASTDEMAQLNAQALKLGADTQFSAGEAADAMLELAKAGLDTSTIMGGALAGTLTLAAAGGTDLATASTIASNALNTFKLSGQDMASVAAALAGGANASTASVESLGMALQQVGPGATNAGLSLNDTVAALAAFDSAGIKGSDAGTSLKTMLARLVPTTKQAATAMDQLGLDFVKGNGEFESLTNIAGQLQARLKTLAPAQRQAALQAIFGSDATRAATVLMNEGSKGLRAYIRATKDMDAAQEQANARMSGTEGALEKLSGAFETAQLRLGQEFAPAMIGTADLLDDKLVPAIEGTIKVGKEIGRALAPAAEEVAEALGNLAGEGESVGKIFDSVFLPTLEAAAEVVGGLVDFIDDLPGPVKEIGLQVGIAALVFPRFSAGVSGATAAMTLNIAKLQQLRAEMTYTATRTQLTGAAMSRLAGAAKSAAGIGGMVALTQGAQESNQALKDLYMVGGGVAAGAAFGPVGAIVGGIAGALGAVATSSDEAKDGVRESAKAVRESIGSWEDYASTLDQVTGSITRQTRKEAARRLQDAGAIELAQKLGISTGDLVKASLGREGASRRVQAALAAELTTTGAYVDAQGKFHTGTQLLNADASKLGGILGLQSKEISKATAETQELAIASGDLSQALKGVQGRGKIITRIETQGWPEAESDVRKLLKGLELTPEEVQTTIEALGVEGAIKDVKGFVSTVVNQAAQAKTAGDSVGSNIGRGMYEGLGRWISPLATRSAGMVSAAIKSAQTAGQIESPSRKMIWVGEMLGEGLTEGMARKTGNAQEGGRNLIKAALSGATGGSAGVDSALSKLTKVIEKSIKGKKQAQREKAALKSLKDQFKQLRLNGQAQDAINAKLEIQRGLLAEARQAYNDYARTIRDAVAATGDVTQLGRQDDGTVSLTSLLNELDSKAIRAERFQILMQELADQGLSRTAIDQMLAAGPEAALATAEAIKTGGAAAITEINTLQTRLDTAGAALGKNMADRYYKTGVDAAQGLVNGLLSQLAVAEAAGERIGEVLVKATKKKLKSKSPSKVFQEIGGDVVDGLRIGIDQNSTYARGSAANLAGEVVYGFGTPALQAYTSGQGVAGSAVVINLHLTADVISDLQAGKRIIRQVRAAEGQGSRVVAVMGA